MAAGDETEVVVVGAGVSGLATACRLHARGHRVIVLERQVKVGGNAVSERIDGFLMEHGPSSVNALQPQARRLSRALGLAAEECELTPAVRHRYLVKGGRLEAIPLHPFGLFTSSYLSWPARLRSLAEPLVPRRKEDGEETVAAFWRRRFGREFERGVIDPLVGGLFAGRSAELSMEAVFPKMVELERRHGSITRAMVVRRRFGSTMPGRRLFSWREGVASLPRALAAALGEAVRTGVTVRRIVRAADGFRLDLGERGKLLARAVVLATQPHVAGTLLETLDAPATEAAHAIPAPPIAVVFMGLARNRVAHPLDGIGCLVPGREGRPANGILFCSSMFPQRAPDGRVALAVYLGGARSPELARLPPPELAAIARDEAAELLGIEGEPEVTRIRQWPRGLPQYLLGHPARARTILGVADRQPGLFVTGNYLGGLSVADCVALAETTAAKVAAHLVRAAPPVAGRLLAGRAG